LFFETRCSSILSSVSSDKLNVIYCMTRHCHWCIMSVTPVSMTHLSVWHTCECHTCDEWWQCDCDCTTCQTEKLIWHQCAMVWCGVMWCLCVQSKQEEMARVEKRLVSYVCTFSLSLSVHLYVCPSVGLPVCLSVSVCMSMYVLLYWCVCVCLCVCLCLCRVRCHWVTGHAPSSGTSSQCSRTSLCLSVSYLWHCHNCFLVLCVPKKEATKLLLITFSNLNRFSKFFHCWIEDEISNKTA